MTTVSPPVAPLMVTLIFLWGSNSSNKQQGFKKTRGVRQMDIFAAHPEIAVLLAMLYLGSAPQGKKEI